MTDNRGMLFDYDPVKVRTPIGRALWPFLLEKDKPKDPKQKSQYRMELIFPIGTDLTALKTVIMNAAKSKWPDGLPKNFNDPLKDGNKKIEEDGLDVENDDIAKALKDSKYIKVKTEYPVPVGRKVNGMFTEITNPEEIYGGMWCLATLKARPYEYLKKTGVTLYMSLVCKTKDGPKLGFKDNPDKDFADIPDFESDETAYGSSSSSTPAETSDYDKYFNQDSGTPDFLKGPSEGIPDDDDIPY